MIQRERERRAQEAAALEAMRADEAMVAAEEQVRFQEGNRKFVEGLKIPEYLQGIIDEEKLIGAYVLWKVSGDYIKIKDGLSKVFATSISLVRDFSYLPPLEGGDFAHPDDPVSHSTIYYGGKPGGWSFRSIDILGSAQEQLLIVPSTKVVHGLQLLHDHDSMKYDYYSGCVLRREIFNNPELLQQIINSLYLDYGGSFREQRGDWPFEGMVPEAEAVRDRIARGEETPVLPASPTLPQRPGFLNRLLGRG